MQSIAQKLAELKASLARLESEQEEIDAKKCVYTLDIETDPFLFGRFPTPFVCGIYDGKRFVSFWGADCIDRAFQHLVKLPPGIIYAHNGGRFDILYFLRWILGQRTRIINRRIISVEMPCLDGMHEFRDSLAIFPFALKQYQKDEIDYAKMEADQREQNKAEILSYLRSDCVYLHELCTAFHKRFGPRLTIGSTSMKEIQSMHEFQCLSETEDYEIRGGKGKDGSYKPGFYYGGRVQCFKKGVMRGTFNIYDVNSMYPYVMRDFKHPLGMPGWESKTVSIHTCFVIAEGENYGAFPVRDRNGIRFDISAGVFHVSVHEWKTALEYGLFKPKRIIRCINFGERGSFRQFVDTFYNARKQAKKDGDKIHELMYKFVLNSGYGKFAQNPLHYKEYTITDSTGDLRSEGWSCGEIDEGQFGGNGDGYIIWEKPTKDHVRYNVATAASITGAARSVLLSAIAQSVDPVYCDTDSIICQSLSGVKFSASELGSWKHEGVGTSAAIAGKKLYAIFDGKECIKFASKGVNVTPEEIREVAQGKEVMSKRDAPTMRLDGTFNFITRKVRMT